MLFRYTFLYLLLNNVCLIFFSDFCHTPPLPQAWIIAIIRRSEIVWYKPLSANRQAFLQSTLPREQLLNLKVDEIFVEQILKTLSARPKSTQNGYYRKMSTAVLFLGVISNTEAFPSFMSCLHA